MKSLKLAMIVSSIMLAVAGVAQAESATGVDQGNRLNHNFMSKRAYQAPVENNKANKVDEQWEGATLIEEDENSAASKNARNLKQLKINSLGRRPYME
jgi:hypothetical protein